MIIYLLGHVSPFLPAVSNSIFQNLSLQTLAYAEEDEFDEEDEDEDEEKMKKVEMKKVEMKKEKKKTYLT